MSNAANEIQKRLRTIVLNQIMSAAQVNEGPLRRHHSLPNPKAAIKVTLVPFQQHANDYVVIADAACKLTIQAVTNDELYQSAVFVNDHNSLSLRQELVDAGAADVDVDSMIEQLKARSDEIMGQIIDAAVFAHVGKIDDGVALITLPHLVRLAPQIIEGLITRCPAIWHDTSNPVVPSPMSARMSMLERISRFILDRRASEHLLRAAYRTLDPQPSFITLDPPLNGDGALTKCQVQVASLLQQVKEACHCFKWHTDVAAAFLAAAVLDGRLRVQGTTVAAVLDGRLRVHDTTSNKVVIKATASCFNITKKPGA